MRRTLVMLPEPIWREVQELSAEQGNSASQFIRQATIAMIFYERGKQGDRELARAIRLARGLSR